MYGCRRIKIKKNQHLHEQALTVLVLFIFAWLVAFNIMTGLKNKNR
jgi:hypothetical protein